MPSLVRGGLWEGGEHPVSLSHACAGGQEQIYSLFGSAHHRGCLLGVKRVCSLDNTRCLVATDLTPAALPVPLVPSED